MQSPSIAIHPASLVALLLAPLGILFVDQVLYGNQNTANSNGSSQQPSDLDVSSAEGGSGGSHNRLDKGSNKDTTPQFTGYRLPTDIVPQHYELRLRTHLEAGGFGGTVYIEVACVTPTSVVRLHSKGLRIDKKNIRVNELGIKSVEVPKEDSDNDFLIINLKEELTIGSVHLLRIPFSGRLDGDLPGYRLLKYTQADANKQVVNKLLAVTQFELAHAREVFPCFDEPHMKASFTITLSHKKEYKAISNMPLKNRIGPDVNDWVYDEFETSVAMPTYTVAFMVSELDSIKFSGDGEDLISYEIWCRHEMHSQLAFVREDMPKILKDFGALFGTKFPFNKMALAAVPNLSHGAKTNKGLLIFSEENVLMDDDQSNGLQKFQVGWELARELAQQWIGHLVTMKWWTDYWFNKGIAFYMSSLVLPELFEEAWGIYDYSMGTSLLKVLSLDSFQSSNPISAPIDSPRKINQISDDITYFKGLAVINMISSIVGKDEFKAGVGSYLKEFQSAAAGQDEFWKAITRAAGTQQVLPSGVSMQKLVDSWTKQAGYPVLTVKRENGTVTVSQKRFFKGKPKSEDTEKGCWFVPVTFANEDDNTFSTKPKPNMWLSCDQREISFYSGFSADRHWIIVNNNAAGIYRVNYDEKSWDTIANKLLDLTRYTIPPVNRMMLVSDAMELAYVGQLSYQKAFRVLHHVATDASPFSWQAAILSLEDLTNLLIRTEKFISFKPKVQYFAGTIFSRYELATQYNSMNILHTRMTNLAYSFACKYENADCQTKAKSLWTTYFHGASQNRVPTGVRGTVYCEVVRQGGEDEWNNAFKYYQETNIATEMGLIVEALACTKQEALLNKLLDWSLKESSGIHKHDSWRVFWATADYSKLGFEVALKFLQNNLKAIHNYNKPNTSVLAKYFEVLAKKLVYKDEIDKMKQFANDNQKLLEDSWAGVTQAMEQMDINLHWHETHYNTIETFLNYLDPPSQSFS